MLHVHVCMMHAARYVPMHVRTVPLYACECPLPLYRQTHASLLTPSMYRASEMSQLRHGIGGVGSGLLREWCESLNSWRALRLMVQRRLEGSGQER